MSGRWSRRCIRARSGPTRGRACQEKYLRGCDCLFTKHAFSAGARRIRQRAPGNGGFMYRVRALPAGAVHQPGFCPALEGLRTRGATSCSQTYPQAFRGPFRGALSA
jgi:hypothetical protein